MSMRALFAAALATVVVGAPVALAPSAADSSAASAPINPEKPVRLDRLFAALRAAPLSAEGSAIEQDILAEWLRSGDVEVDGQMAAAIVGMNTGDLEGALAILNDIVAKRPDYVEGWNKRATIYYYMDDYEHSLADIAATLRLEPRHFGALNGLGMIMINLGDRSRALMAFERAYAADPAQKSLPYTIEMLKKAGGGKDI
jgi:tetratricopeptide (TPR) repeat protein